MNTDFTGAPTMRHLQLSEDEASLTDQSLRSTYTQIPAPAQPHTYSVERNSLSLDSRTIHKTQDHRYTRIPGSDVAGDFSYPGNASSKLPTHTPQPHPRERPWFPYTLRWPYLAAIVATTIVLLLIVVYLSIKSSNNDGLLDNNDSESVFFSWKFAPTLIAVIYGLLVTMILDDVKRTEPYVRLAKPDGALAEVTLLQTPGAWWNALLDGFSKKKNQGRWSWSLICSATSTIYTILVISPFSSTLLVAKDVIISKPMLFSSFPVLQQKPMTFSDQNITRFHTMSHMLQNVTTSAWISDQYAVLPFWPSKFSAPPLGAVLGTDPETWHANTLVFQIQYECEQLHLTSTAVTNASQIYDYGNRTRTVQSDTASAILIGDNGCMNGIATSNDSNLVSLGGWLWTQPGNLTAPGSYTAFSDWPGDSTVFNHSSECTGPETFFILRPWIESEFITAQNCNPSYYFANISTQASISRSGDSLVTFDEDDFRSNRKLIDSDTLDLRQLQDMFLSIDWTSHLTSPSSIYRPPASGPAVVLAAIYDFSASNAITDPDLTGQVRRLRQRYFGEVLRTSLSLLDPEASVMSGKVVAVKSRVVVVQPVAFLIGIALLLNVILLTSLFWTASSKRRSLGLTSDPAQASLVAQLLMRGSTSQHELKRLKETSEEQRKVALHGTRAWIEAGRLSLSMTSSPDDLQAAKGIATEPDRGSSWRPFVLKRWTIIVLALLLLVILATVLTLRQLSQGPGLYSKAFVYEVSLSFSDRHVTTLAPYSILPTLVGVAVALWWGSMETEFRALQPFIAMTKEGTAFKGGINLTYQSSYLIWAAVKAGRYRHWILAIVCFGALLSQIFTTAMSALWQIELGFRSFSTSTTRTLELRNIPILSLSTIQTSVHAGDTAAATVLAALYGELTQNWLYSATNALTLNGSEPAWSKEGWSFVPVDLSRLEESALVPANNVTTVRSANGSLGQTLATTTLQISTPAIRARLECSEWTGLDDTSRYTYSLDIKNASVWNVSVNPDVGDVAYGLGCNEVRSTINLIPDSDLSDPCYGFVTSVYTTAARVTCCENNTVSQNGSAAIGYWTQNYAWAKEYNNILAATSNFTVKWMYGNPVGGFYQNGSHYDEYMVWPTPPRLTALNCMPIIERANATIELELGTAQIQRYDILEKAIVDDNAWSDDFVRYNNPSEFNGTEREFGQNITTSYGILFLNALLRAANLGNLGRSDEVEKEDLSDNTFNFRSPGVNMDTMSYSMFSLVDQNPEALLDSKTLYRLANKTFSTFFQHYVSTNVSLVSGGWAYQKINETLPTDLLSQRSNGSQIPIYQPPPVSTTNRTAEILVHIPVKKLQMSSIAAWICVSILAWMIATTAVIISVERRYLAKLIYGTKTLADVGILVAGSDALLSHVASGSPDHRDSQPLKTKLGWFRDRDGQKRWGIELHGEEWGVEWLDDEEVNSHGKRLKKDGYEMVNLQDKDSSQRRQKRPISTIRVTKVNDGNEDPGQMEYDSVGRGLRPTY